MVLPFECEGFWWLPLEPDKMVPGTLRCDAEANISLNLVGVLPNAEEARSIGHRLILGEADSSPVGRLITLQGCTVAGESSSQPGLHRQRFVVSKLYGGRHLQKEDDFRFGSSTLSYSGLPVWSSDLTGFTPNSSGIAPGSFSIQWQRPPSVKGDIPGARITIGLGANLHHGMRERVLRETVSIHLNFVAPLSLEEINDAFVYPIQNLLTLACDAPNAITDWALGSVDGRGTVQFIAPRTFSGNQASEFVPFFHLFNLSDVQENISSVLTRWLSLHRELADPCNLYFGMQYAPTPYLDLQFQTLVQAITLYGTRRGMSRAVPALVDLQALEGKADERERELLKSFLDDNIPLATQSALMGLLEHHGTAMQPLISNGMEFTSRVIETLRYVLHRNPELSTRAVQGPALYVLIQTCDWLMKLCFLAELGFTPEKRAAIVLSNSRVRHLGHMARDK